MITSLAEATFKPEILTDYSDRFKININCMKIFLFKEVKCFENKAKG